MARWQRSIEIEATPAHVWSVVANVGAWPEWTDSILSVEDVSQPFGAGGSALVQALGQPKSVFRVTHWEPGHGFDWETKARGARAIAGHWIEPAGAGRSRVTLSVTVPGLLAAVLKPVLARGIERNLTMEAEGLKRRSEATA